jgi:hypothetical protein
VSSSTNEVSSEIRETLQDLLLKVQPAISAYKLWTEILTQEERERLGGNLDAIYAGGKTVGIWLRLHRVSKRRAIIEVARKLEYLSERAADRLICEIGEQFDSIEDAIEEAKRSVALVINERDREVYFDGACIELDWHHNQAGWNYFINLCRLAKNNSTLDRTHLGDHADKNYLSKQKSRLTKNDMFPIELADRIVDAGRGTQRLNLPPDEIRIFEIHALEVLKEVY